MRGFRDTCIVNCEKEKFNVSAHKIVGRFLSLLFYGRQFSSLWYGFSILLRLSTVCYTVQDNNATEIIWNNNVNASILFSYLDKWSRYHLNSVCFYIFTTSPSTSIFFFAFRFPVFFLATSIQYIQGKTYDANSYAKWHFTLSLD